MTTTMTPMSALLPVAPAPVKPADGGNPGAGDSTPFARELDRAQEADDHAPTPARGGKRSPRSPAPADRPAAAKAAGEADGPARSGEGRVADAAGTDTDTDTDANTSGDAKLPADLAALINGLLGLPAAPGTSTNAAVAPSPATMAGAAGAAPTAESAAAAAEAGRAAGALAALTGTVAGAGKAVSGSGASTVPATPAGDDRSGDAPTAGSGPSKAADAAQAAPSTTELQSIASDARASLAASAEARGPAPGPADTLARPATEPLPNPAAATAAGGVAAHAVSTSSSPASPTSFEARLHAALGSPEFAPAIGQQIRVLVQDGVQHARLHLNPAEMGPITVQIALDGSAAQVHLAAEQPLTRQALEQAMPVLASSLREGGLTLSGGGVFEQPRDPQRDGSAAQTGRSGRPDGPMGDDAGRGAAAGVTTRRLRGAVDLIA